MVVDCRLRDMKAVPSVRVNSTAQVFHDSYFSLEEEAARLKRHFFP